MTQGSKARILIAEDEGIVALEIRQRLIELGYEVVHSVRTGEEAISFAGELRPDLVLMDIRLGGSLDGIAAAGQIHAQWQVPIIFLTAYADEATVRRASGSEPFGYILKPFEDRDLRTTIEIALVKNEAERRLRQSERRYATMLNSIGDAVVATDVEGRITFVNAVAEALSGWPRNDALGRPLSEVLPLMDERTLAPVDDPVARTLQEGRTIKLSRGTQLVSRTGGHIPIDETASPIHEEEGKITGVVLSFRDMSRDRALEEQLRQAQKMEAVGQLAGGVAHDFNNLLTIINGYTDLVLASLPEETPAHAHLSQVQKSGQRAAELTRQLLAFSRRQVLRPRVTNLNQIVSGVEKMLRRVLGEDIELVPYLASELPQVYVDPGQIEQVLVNLATNARDAMPRGGRLTLRTSIAEVRHDEVFDVADLAPGPYVCLEVADTGCGMPEEVRKRIFEPFFTTKEVGRGTGLGLSIVYGIVKASGGHITVTSEPQGGSCFTLYLPTAREEAVARESNSEFAELPHGTETLLLVEDEEGVRELTALVLRSCGYTVLEARNGIEAVQVSAKQVGTIDLLVTDLVMPNIHGVQVAHLLQSQRPGIKVLFVTGYPRDAAAQELQRMPDAEVLLKPYTPAGLAERVRLILDS